MNELQKNADHLQTMWKIAQQFSQASLVPDTFRGKPADVFLVMGWCDSVGLDYMSGLQGTNVVHGKVGPTAALQISLANARGPFDGPICYETTGKGDSMAVTAYGMIGDKRHEKTISMAIAKAEGWTKNSKYKTIPEQMLSYRAATFLIRLYCPEVASCLQTTEEIIDVHAASYRTVEAVPSDGPAAELNDMLEPRPLPQPDGASDLSRSSATGEAVAEQRDPSPMKPAAFVGDDEAEEERLRQRLAAAYEDDARRARAEGESSD